MSQTMYIQRSTVVSAVSLCGIYKLTYSM